MASGAGVAKVTLEILDAVEIAGFAQRKLQVPFNPTELSADRDATYAEVAIPGLDAPVLQYVRGGGEKLNLELFFDVTDLMVDGVVADGSSVRDRYVQPLQRLTLVDRVLHAPPRVRVAWDAQVLIERAVVTSVSVTYTLFDTQGRPVRATARVAFRQHTSASAQLAEIGLTSPDLTNVATVRQGDTLPAIAFREYGDPTRWRSIAEANAISNPLDLAPGRVLVVPKIV